MNLTPRQRHILRHSLGMADSGPLQPFPYRNWYSSPAGTADRQDCEELVAAGLMAPIREGEFEVTAAGMEVCS